MEWTLIRHGEDWARCARHATTSDAALSQDGRWREGCNTVRRPLGSFPGNNGSGRRWPCSRICADENQFASKTCKPPPGGRHLDVRRGMCTGHYFSGKPWTGSTGRSGAYIFPWLCLGLVVGGTNVPGYLNHPLVRRGST